MVNWNPFKPSPPPQETIKEVVIPPQIIPPINVRPTDKPGETVARSQRENMGGGGGGSSSSTIPSVNSGVDILALQAKEAQQKAQQDAIAKAQAIEKQAAEQRAIQQAETKARYQAIAQQQLAQEQQKGFTGKVEQIKEGKITETKYFISGKETSPQNFSEGVQRVVQPSQVNIPLALEQIKQQAIQQAAQEAQNKKTTTTQVSNLDLARLREQVNYYQKGTIKDFGKPNINAGKIYTEPYLTRFETGTIATDTTTGQTFKTLGKLQYIDPTVLGEQFQREATPQEEKYFKEQTSVLQASTQKYEPFKIKFGDIVQTAKNDIYQANIAVSNDLKEYGLTDKNIDKIASKLFNDRNPVEEFLKGATIGIVKDIRDRPLTNIAEIGIGYVFGLAAEGIPLFTREVLRLAPFTERFAPTITKTTKGGVTSLGLGIGALYVGEKGYEVLSAKTPEEAGKITGLTTKDILLTGYGISKGTKGALQIQGYLETKGRIELPFEKLTTKEIISGEDKFLLVQKSKQVSMFKDFNPYDLPITKLSRYSGEGELIFPEAYKDLPFKMPGGSYHTTPSIFFKEGTITPKAGTSELPGLYVSTGISPAFAKLPGSSGKFDLVKYITELFRVSEPGVAYLQPKGFRYSPFKEVNPYKIGEQTFKYKFLNEPKQGYADIPLMKQEAEAILREEAGSYGLTGKQYYTTINGVRVPIDTFKFDETIGKASKGADKQVETFSSSRYTNLPSTKKPFTFGSETTSITTSKPSYVSEIKRSSTLSSSRSLSSPFSSSVSLGSSESSVSSSSSVNSIISSVSSLASSPSSPYSMIRKKSPPSYISTSSTSERYFPFSFFSVPGKPKYKKVKIAKPSYSVLIKRRGRFSTFRSGLPQGLALRATSNILLKNLARTGKIVQTGETFQEDINFKPSRNLFRTYQIRKGVKKPLAPFTYIQRTKSLLQTPEEKIAIKESKRQANIFKSVYSKRRR